MALRSTALCSTTSLPFRRSRAVVLSVAALGTVGLAACAPPGQVTSTEKGTLPPVFTSSPPPAGYAPGGEHEAQAPVQEGAKLTADIKGNDGKTIGTVTFTDVDNAIKVTIEAKGLTPGNHGWHVHEKSVCDGDFTSAGPHLMKDNVDVGGQFPTLFIQKDGSGTLTTTTDLFTWEDLTNGGNGRAVVIHDVTDTNKRVACGVVKE